MNLPLSLRLAARELRGGLRGFRIFLLCLALGVAAIAAVGTVRAAIQAGLEAESAVMLGGEAEITFTYRFAEQAERDWMAQNAASISEIADFRSMIVNAEQDRAMTQVKAVDTAWPLLGRPVLSPDIDITTALEARDGRFGIVAQSGLVDRLGLQIGDVVSLGAVEVELRAVLVSEPDSNTAGFGFGPRSVVQRAALEGSGMLSPGTLFDSRYRMMLPLGSDIAVMRADARERFSDSGLRWRDASRGVPGVESVVERLGAFLLLVGLAGMAVGGIGVSAAVRAYLERKSATIATLKTVGATSGLIFAVYLIQIGALALLGISAGLALGAGLPVAFGGMLEAALPVPTRFALYAAPMVEAAIYGVLIALIFSLWPLASAIELRAATLFRDADMGRRHRPRGVFVAVLVGLAALLIGLASVFSGVALITLAAAAGILVAMALLWLAARATRALARRLARSRLTRGRPALRLALGSLGGPGGETTSAILSLGLGLSVLAAIGQIDSNLQRSIAGDLPERAPAFFFLDIANTEIDDFRARAEQSELVTDIDSAPMLRGIITRINDRAARDVAPGSWVLRGDRGVTYADTLPEGSVLTAGEWWDSDYAGPPLVSFSADAASEIGLSIGDSVTVNILGRDLTATVANFREIDFATMGINFIMVFNPSALSGAPHSHIATVYAGAGSEGPLLRDLARAFPNVTAISVREAIAMAAELIGSAGAGIRIAASITLLTGFVVLIGAAAAGERSRAYEAAVLKTLGASRRRILSSFALRALIIGSAAGFVALFAGSAASWGVMVFVMEADWHLDLVSALVIIALGAGANLGAGLAFALRPLAARPARVLRARD